MTTPSAGDQWHRNEFESGEETHIRRKSLEKFLSCPSTFSALQVQLVVLASAFVMVSRVWSVSCLLFFYSRRLPPCPAICKSGGHVPPCPIKSASLLVMVTFDLGNPAIANRCSPLSLNQRADRLLCRCSCRAAAAAVAREDCNETCSFRNRGRRC